MGRCFGLWGVGGGGGGVVVVVVVVVVLVVVDVVLNVARSLVL